MLGNETEDLPTSPIGRQPSVTLGVPGVPSSRVGAHAWHLYIFNMRNVLGLQVSSLPGSNLPWQCLLFSRPTVAL